MTDERDSPETQKDANSGLLGIVRLLVTALAEAEREGNTTFTVRGQTPGDTFSTEYGISGEVGGIRPDEGDGSVSPSKPADSTAKQDDERPVGVREDDDEYLVEVRKNDDELLVVADMPDIDVDDITAGFEEERDELVILVEGQELERVQMPWHVAGVESKFQHGILELRLEREVRDDE